MFEVCTDPAGKKRAEAIAQLNDEIRRNPRGPGKKLMITPGVQALGPIAMLALCRAVACFSSFTNDTNPHGERDFGAVEIGTTKVWFKIDYYDPDMEHGADDPTDPDKTVRVLTLMLPDEY